MSLHSDNILVRFRKKYEFEVKKPTKPLHYPQPFERHMELGRVTIGDITHWFFRSAHNAALFEQLYAQGVGLKADC